MKQFSAGTVHVNQGLELWARVHISQAFCGS